MNRVELLNSSTHRRVGLMLVCANRLDGRSNCRSCRTGQKLFHACIHRDESVVYSLRKYSGLPRNDALRRGAFSMTKPTLFIGSSKEGIEFARAIRFLLVDTAEIEVWHVVPRNSARN
jgi:hypothetical protein